MTTTITAPFEFNAVSAIYGAADYEQSRSPTEGYAVRDRHDRLRHLGYVARVGPRWKAVRPERFDSMVGFHNARHGLTGNFDTRDDAARHLRELVPA